MIGWVAGYSLRTAGSCASPPASPLTAVLTLAMALAANAVVFSVMNGLVLRPLHVLRPEVSMQSSAGPRCLKPVVPDFLDLRARNRSFGRSGGYCIPQVGLTQVRVHPRPGDWRQRELLPTHSTFNRISGRFFHASDETWAQQRSLHRARLRVIGTASSTTILASSAVSSR